MARCSWRDLINYAALMTTVAEGAPMNRILITLILCGLGSAAYAAHPHAFKLTSTAFAAHGTLSDEQVFNSFGCSGKNLSPALHWSGAPQGTQSFALMVYDPDAPTGSGWWHWVVSNIPAGVTELPTGASGTAAMPVGAVESRTDYGVAGYGGAAPPPGPPHHYIFTVYAMKVPSVEVTPESSAAMVGFLTHFNSLAKASLTAFYGV